MRRAGWLLAAAATAGTLVWRRRRDSGRSRASLFYDDGSMVSFGDGSDEADRLVPLADEILAAARA
jgi:hypothetical protein